MDRKKLLVIATAPVEPGPLRDAVREHAGDEAEIRVVAPASDVSPLQWLASDEDEAREKAAEVGLGAAATVEPEAAARRPRSATRTPFRRSRMPCGTFPADEVLVVTRPEDDATWLEQDSAQAARERFGVPVTRLTV